MKIIGINGSPRKNWNSSRLLASALEGAAAAGAETKNVNLFDLNFHGCRSCFACKLLGASTFGRCAWKDGLSPLLDEIRDNCDGIILSAPVYFSDFPGAVRDLIERLFFPLLTYSEHNIEVGRPMRNALVIDMGASEEMSTQFGYPQRLWGKETMGTFPLVCEWLLGSCEVLPVYDSYQFSDYSKYSSSLFDLAHKTKALNEELPKSLAKANELGRRLVESSK